MTYTLTEPSAAVQLIGAALSFAFVALIALAAKLSAVIRERNTAHNAAIEIRRDRDNWKGIAEKLDGVVSDLHSVKAQLAADLNTARAQLDRVAVTRDPKTGRMVSNKPKTKTNEQ